MKSARIITKTNKKAKLHTNGNNISMPVINGKTSVKKSFSKTNAKISAQTQFSRIKKALDEVELIEAGSIKPTSLKEALNEL